MSIDNQEAADADASSAELRGTDAWPALRLLRCASIAVPVFVALVWAWFSWNVERQYAVDRAAGSAELLREYALRVFEMQRSLLIEAEHLIADLDVEAADQETIHAHMEPLVGRLRMTLGVGVVGSDGEILGSTAYPVSGSAVERNYFQKLRAGDTEFLIERVMLENEQEALLLAKRRPGPEFHGILVAAIDLDAAVEFFARVAADDDDAASLVSEDGALLMRHPPLPPVFLPLDSPLMGTAISRMRGTVETASTFDGIERIYAFVPLNAFPAFAMFGQSSRSVFIQWWQNFSLPLVFLSVVGVLGFVASTLALRSVRSEARERELIFDRRLLVEAERVAEARGQLLREAHHRIKNSLQMMLSMIRQKANAMGDPGALSDIEHRLLALSQLHDHLYLASHDGTVLDVGSFLNEICHNPSIVPPEQNVELDCQVEPLKLQAAQAVPIALIAVEIITNSLKYAFPKGSAGRITVALRREADEAVFTFADNGKGLPPKEKRERNSGLRLVEALVAQLDGHLDIALDGGTTFTLRLPLAEHGDIQASMA